MTARCNPRERGSNLDPSAASSVTHPRPLTPRCSRHREPMGVRSLPSLLASPLPTRTHGYVHWKVSLHTYDFSQKIVSVANTPTHMPAHAQAHTHKQIHWFIYMHTYPHMNTYTIFCTYSERLHIFSPESFVIIYSVCVCVSMYVQMSLSMYGIQKCMHKCHYAYTHVRMYV